MTEDRKTWFSAEHCDGGYIIELSSWDESEGRRRWDRIEAEKIVELVNAAREHVKADVADTFLLLMNAVSEIEKRSI